MLSLIRIRTSLHEQKTLPGWYIPEIIQDKKITKRVAANIILISSTEELPMLIKQISIPSKAYNFLISSDD